MGRLIHPLKIQLIGLLACWLVTATATAQYVSLTTNELIRLKTRISQDTAAARLIASFWRQAALALQEQPNPIQKIESQGLLEGDSRKVASLKAVKDGDKVYALALAYRVYGKQDYKLKAVAYLTAWAETNQPTGDPINETKLEPFITGYDLIRPELSIAQRQPIDAWLDHIADGEVHSFSIQPGKGTVINNWNSHRIKIITLIAYTLHSSKYEGIIIPELEKQIGQNLNADGTTLDFIERDAFHYHTYDLEPLLTAAIAIKRATGKNYFMYESDKKASIKKSVDFIIPYMTGEKQHGEFVNSRVEFDRKRAANHEKGYAAGTPFNPQSGVYLLSLASYFNPDYASIIQQVSRKKSKYLNWTLLLSQIKRTN
ncbi:hypothetical protein HH214_10895 [Mucilaginibacter robiniae]|uniref:Alginate lyase domain-containing protein n=1 Tax=Mucilaginibacter robiniae TaxID=2728022 RepID=A0A7L5E7I7_9SPHI|nr:alginate lyase family protein [Mucilaginibacter robiniae]QJD96336.1 hypothetical protein HH214_10895 [Mucilaginibacter robiniae]